jgi:hypothetical protein
MALQTCFTTIKIICPGNRFPNKVIDKPLSPLKIKDTTTTPFP